MPLVTQTTLYPVGDAFQVVTVLHYALCHDSTYRTEGHAFLPSAMHAGA